MSAILSLPFISIAPIEDVDTSEVISQRAFVTSLSHSKGHEDTCRYTASSPPHLSMLRHSGPVVFDFENPGSESCTNILDCHANRLQPLIPTCVTHRFGTTQPDSHAFWKEILTFLKTGSLPKCTVAKDEEINVRRRWARYFLHNGQIWIHPTRNTLPVRVIQDLEHRIDIVAEAHNQCGHRGRDSTYLYLRDRYFWPGMYNSVALHCHQCIICHNNIYHTSSTPFPTSSFRHFTMDTLPMMIGDMLGKNFLHHVQDSQSTWMAAAAEHDNDEDSIARFLHREVILRFGCRAFFTVGKDVNFSRVADILSEKYSQTVYFSYVSEASECLRAMKLAQATLVCSIYACAGSERWTWPLYVYAVILALRVTVSRETGYTPYFMVYGTHGTFAFDFDDMTWQLLPWTSATSTLSLITTRAKQFARIGRVAREICLHPCLDRAHSIIDSNRRSFIHDSFQGFDLGMWVLRAEEQPPADDADILPSLWSGPYILHKQKGDGLFCLREVDGVVIPGCVAAHRLKLFRHPSPLMIIQTCDPIQLNHTSSQPSDTTFEQRYIAHVSGVDNMSNQHVLPVVTRLYGHVHQPSGQYSFSI